MTVALMLIFFILYLISVLYGVKYNENKENYFDIHDTRLMRGIFCIIVVLVHVPVLFQNKIQDVIGSFAYIGVTFFFMTSAFGLKYSVANNSNYLTDLWKRRLPSILVPAILCNLVNVLFSVYKGNVFKFISLLDINGWVKVLLLFYLIFWIVNIIYIYIYDKTNCLCADLVIIFAVICCSLTDWFTEYKLTLIWPTESWGFVYGILLADFYNKAKNYMSKNWLHKCTTFFSLGIILGICYIKFKPIYFWGNYCLKIILGFVLLLLLLQLSRKLQFGNRVLWFLGGISYEVYLLHFGIYSLMEFLFKDMNSSVFILISIIITLLLAVILNYLSKFCIKFLNKKMS